MACYLKIIFSNYVYYILIVFFLNISWLSFSQSEIISKSIDIEQGLSHTQIKIDSLSDNKQFINILRFLNNNLDYLELTSEIGLNKLDKTSLIATEYNALAAVNGGFFNMKSGNLVTYFEKNDTIVYKTISDSIRRSQPDYFLNGAVIIDTNNKLQLGFAQLDDFYKESKNEKLVMVTGPVLLKNGKSVGLPMIAFVINRHPRTCICTSDEEIFLITIDGRSLLANGMSLLELQKFLLDLGCKDALNLDGGGSTTMWIKDKGIVNMPSDKKGERPVSNVLMIVNKS
ncbi:phosphodiester glycosidase family protein [Aureibaculum sp. 2210JD6-5]|uniref:phosphodiester glycosidase family protein n=1 Tax=Aureibaculum sp. 2210JD6-5 TaxID=3103957 RepID=UPI002AAEA126|nr:phosphodiester glycosidase family protein [Aureibaculum sp. 2210JD6-5]MDY7396040.1 phosphodiester glycosidase family protein [Aureibaculum sp. 2210JD6-5]